jgi:predicted acetyltransferase
VDLTFRPPKTRDEALRFFRLACPALLVPVAQAEAWMEREGYDHLWLAFEGGSLVGGCLVPELAQYFGGKAVPTGAFRGVAIAPEARGKSIAERLMRHALLALRDQGIPAAMLFPATQRLYRKAGFEQAGSYEVVSIPMHEFDRAPRSFTALGATAEIEALDVLPVREVTLDDPILKVLYDALAPRTQGLFQRNAWLWDRVFRPALPLDLFAYVFGPHEDPEGYVVVHVEKGATPHYGTLVVRDRAIATVGAARAARAFFARYRSTIDRVRFVTGPTDPLIIGLDNQQTAATERRDRFMFRVVDVKKALEARGYPPIDATVHLLVKDDVLEERDQRFLLRVQGGQATVEPGGAGLVQLDVRGLSAMYTGYLSATQAASLGYMKGDPSSARALEACFAGPAPWVADYV